MSINIEDQIVAIILHYCANREEETVALTFKVDDLRNNKHKDSLEKLRKHSGAADYYKISYLTDDPQVIKSTPAVPFTDAEHADFANEGWAFIEIIDADNQISIQKLDEEEKFSSDREAWRFIIESAMSGSAVHQRVLQFIKVANPKEHSAFVLDVDVVFNDDILDFKPSTDSEEEPQAWQVLFDCGRIIEFTNEEDACNYQRLYRCIVGLDPQTGE